MGPFDGDGADNFWNPKIRGPVCYSPPASKDQYLTDDEPSLGGSPDVLHPVYGRCCLGCRSAKSPVMRNPQFSGAPEPIDVFMVPTRRWSDGTAASVM
jgi:hypothetical protein